MTPVGGLLGAQEGLAAGDCQGMALAMMPGGGAAGRGIRRALPLDQASRMGRAKAMGFRTDIPLYHGSGASFSEFNAVPTNARDWRTPGVSLALNPEMANEFAASQRANQQVYKLFHRADRPAELEYRGEPHHQIVATLRDAFNSGYDAVTIKNYTTPGGVGPGSIVIVRNANQLRSPNATFDPAKKGSGDLLACLAAFGMVPILAAGAQQDR